jgi:F-type H+-transporting ATPase subunit b
MISIDYTLIIVVLNFILLLIVLNKLLFKSISKFLKERQKKIEEDLIGAEEAKKSAAELVRKKEIEFEESVKEARRLKEVAKHEAEKNADSLIQSAKFKEREILKETEFKLEREREKAIEEIKSDIVNLVSSVTSKILAKDLNNEDDKVFIDQLISKRGRK